MLPVGRPADLDRAAVLAVAAGARPVLAPAVLDAVAARRSEVEAALARGRAVYGVTTGQGAASDVPLTADEQATHQHRLLLARAVGGPPWLPRADVRALLAVRLRTFLEGDAGVTPGLCTAVAALLEADVVPAVPATGAGSTGEIIGLAHAFQVLAGIGSVLRPDGGTEPAADALRAAGLAPWSPAAKEGIALLEGVPGSTALATTLGAVGRALLPRYLEGAALGVVALGASHDPYLAAVARGDDALGHVLQRFRSLIGPAPATPRLQAPVSVRVLGPVAAAVHRRLDQLDEAVDRSLAGVTDSPAFVGGAFVGTAGFYGLDLAAAMDALTVSLVHAAEVSCARVHRLLDDRLSGLPRQLSARPGAEAGLVVVHKRAVGVTHALRRNAFPSTVGLVETSLGQEDVMSFGWEAAAALRGALDGVAEVLACELLVARHALRLAGAPVPPGLGDLVEAVDAAVPPITADRPFGVDVEALRALLSPAR